MNQIQYALLALILCSLSSFRLTAISADELIGIESDVQSQLAEQAEIIRDLEARLSRYDSIFSGLGPGECNSTCAPAIRRIPVVVEETVPPCKKATDNEFHKIQFYVDHDKGFSILPFDKKQTPFEMRINGWIQFRHIGFARDVDSWTDNAGITRPVRNRNAFDIERARLTFKGFALDERLTYFYQLDGDSDNRHTVDFFDYWWAWKFSDSFRLQLGKRKVTASRQWLLGARRTRFIDRPMANDFFRPDRTLGLFGQGSFNEQSHYEVMVGNGYRTSNLPNNVTDDQLTYAATHYIDLGGDYGSQLVDYDYVCSPIMRIGHSFVYSPITSDALGQPLDETDFLRLSDGTRLNQVGALAPGATVSDVDVYFYGVDIGTKWRGWSFNSEFFFRWLNDLVADAPLPRREIYQRGYYVEGGTFLIPKKLDVNFRYSEVKGIVNTATEYAGGFNWYPCDSHRMKISFDVTVLDGSPLQNTASEILVGDDGVLFRTQFQAEF